MIRFSPAAAGRVFKEYGQNIIAFRPNARLYLLNVILVGAAMGVFRLLFNFYVLSLGFDEALLGNLVTTSSLTALIVALPMGYLADTLGRKKSLLLSGIFIALTVFGMVLWPAKGMLFFCNILSGFAQSLSGVTMAPFLMENSSDKERTYLFSFVSGLQMVSSSVGNWIGGYLPSWVGNYRSVGATSSSAYAGSLVVVAVAAAIAILPLLVINSPQLKRSDRTVFAPISYALKNPGTLGKLILPLFITSIGAGLVMPFQNVFFRQVYHASDPTIGSIFAWGSLSMGIGLLIAPPLADRMGKIRLVVITQGLSIPFLIMLGFAPWFWMSVMAYYVRVGLMNMSSPVYQTFVMEHVEPSARATVASLTSMSWSFGWAFSPMISGWMQVRYGFGPPFMGTILLYIVAVIMYWAFFWKGKVQRVETPLAAPSPGD